MSYFWEFFRSCPGVPPGNPSKFLVRALLDFQLEVSQKFPLEILQKFVSENLLTDFCSYSAEVPSGHLPAVPTGNPAGVPSANSPGVPSENSQSFCLGIPVGNFLLAQAHEKLKIHQNKNNSLNYSGCHF